MFSHKHSLLLQEAIEAYLADIALAGRAKTTQALYRGLLLRLARSVGPERHVKAIRRDDVVRYLSHLSETDCQSYVNLNLRVFKCFFAWLVMQEEIKKSPLAGMTARDPPWAPVPPFTPDECQRLLRATCSHLEQLVVLVLLDTGLRASELCSLRLSDVDLQANELTIQGKGGKRRRVALNPRPHKALLAYLAEGEQVDGLLWPKGWKRQQLAYLLDKLGSRARVTRCHAHRFRHTFACYWALETNDLLALQQICGWESLAMVQRYTAWVAAHRALDIHKQHSVIPAA